MPSEPLEAPIQPRNKHSFTPKKRGKVSFLVNLSPFSFSPPLCLRRFGSKRAGHKFPLQRFAEAMSRKTNMLFLIRLINEEPPPLEARATKTFLHWSCWKWRSKFKLLRWILLEKSGWKETKKVGADGLYVCLIILLTNLYGKKYGLSALK